jgi:hypothetical protein
MKDFYNFLIENTADFNPILRIFIVFILCGLAITGLTFIKNSKFRKQIITFFENKFKLNIKKSLLKHNLFSKKSFFKKPINSLHFESQLKTDLFKLLLNEKINVAIAISENFIKKIDYKIDDEKLFLECSENNLNITNVCENSIHQSFVDYFFDKKNLTKEYAYIIADKEFSFLYLNKDKGFQSKFNGIVENQMIFVKDLFYSKAFTTKQKLFFYLTAISSILEITVTQCEKLFFELNGEIDKIASGK